MQYEIVKMPGLRTGALHIRFPASETAKFTAADEIEANSSSGTPIVRSDQKVADHIDQLGISKQKRRE
jgi:hypothetical protein